MLQAMAAATPHSGPRQVTLEEWALLEDDERELVDGVLTEAEVPDVTHETVVVFLISLLRAWVQPRGGRTLGALKLRVDERRGRLPDVCVYFAGHSKLPPHGLVTIPPDLVVEVVSATPSDAKRDRVHKLDDYAAFGARFYWIVDPALRTLEVWEIGPQGRYSRALAAESGVVSRVPGCEGLSLDLDAMWAEVDALGG